VFTTETVKTVKVLDYFLEPDLRKTLESPRQWVKHQKRVYFIQLCGVDLGYDFKSSNHGPFRQSLTDDLEEYKDCWKDVDILREKSSLTEEAKKKINQAKKIMEMPEGLQNEREWLELLATLHFLAEHSFLGQVWYKVDLEKLKEKLINKTQLDSKYYDFVGVAWERLQKLPRD